jgi:GNAT superfamily N-acetyltransferase
MSGLLRFARCTQSFEWEFAKKLRQAIFFDPLALTDPYTWTFNDPDHLHFILYEGDRLVGYLHIQLWPDQRAAIRIIAIPKSDRNRGLGSRFLEFCEQWLKAREVRTLHTEARPDVVSFYRRNGYHDMPFNDPSGEPPSPHDLAMGKRL